jgi:hypothetical protein
MATLFILPAPWCTWLLRRRQNWVLTMTAMFGFLLFVGVLLSQIMGEMHSEHADQQKGVYGIYQGFTLVREISKEEYESLTIEHYMNQMEKLSRSAAGALLLGYAGIAGYSAWWLLTRPDWRNPIPLGAVIGNRL